MSSLMDLRLVVAQLLFLAFYLLMSAQVLHVFSLFWHRNARPRGSVIAYEVLLDAHLMLMCLLMREVMGHDGSFDLLLGPISLPLLPLLWLNVIAFVLGLFLCARRHRPSMLPELAVLLLSSPPLVETLHSTWAYIVIADAGFFLFRITRELALDAYGRRQRLSRLSTLEAIDALPEGILCADASGHVLLMNEAMRSSLTALGLPGDFVDASSVWQTLRQRAGESSAGTEGYDLLVDVSPDEKRAFSSDEVSIDGRRCQRIFAYNVTEEVRLDAELARANVLLEVAGDELRKSLETVADVADAEAVVSMRSRVHDVIGQRLSILHRYLEDGNAERDSLADVHARLDPIVDTILTDLSPLPAAPAQEGLTALVSAFALIGVDIDLDGKLPSDLDEAAAFVHIVREASTNAVRHAQATHIMVRMEDSARMTSLVVSNDGRALTGDLTPGLGIPGMREAAAKVGASLEVDAGVPFTVTACIDRREETT